MSINITFSKPCPTISKKLLSILLQNNNKVKNKRLDYS